MIEENSNKNNIRNSNFENVDDVFSEDEFDSESFSDDFDDSFNISERVDTPIV